ncbi:MAG: STAS domain-containing protein [Chloroflexi bacterium]|nr:STAS domain-containing protein [Chloroflexota bacterium]
MNEANRTREQLADELVKARRQIARLEALETQHKQVEEALRKSKERSKVLLDSIQAGVVVIDAETHKIIDANLTATEMIGADHKEIIDCVCHEFICPAQEGKCPITDMGQNVDRSERMLIDIQGKRIPILKTVVPKILDGRRYLIESFFDITERKQAEKEQERLQQEIIDAQRRALEEISTPIIPVMDRIIVMPLVGSIDSMRARDITRALLAGIRQQRAKVVILDITGVPVVDSGVASHLHQTIQAARLKGARTIVTGVSNAVAETIVDLGIDWREIETVSDLRIGLVGALSSLGIKLVRQR